MNTVRSSRSPTTNVLERATWILSTFAPTRKVASSWLPLTNWQQTAALTFPEDTWVLIISTPSIIGRGNPISPYSERTQWFQFRSCLVQPMLTISSSSNFIYTGWSIQLRGWYPEEPVIWLFANLPKACWANCTTCPFQGNIHSRGAYCLVLGWSLCQRRHPLKSAGV